MNKTLQIISILISVGYLNQLHSSSTENIEDIPNALQLVKLISSSYPVMPADALITPKNSLQ